MIVVDLEQGSDAWFKEKLGKPSASNCSKLITGDLKPSKQREGYLYELAGEVVTGARVETFKSLAMEEGNNREEESRNLYELMKNVKVDAVGVIYPDERKRYLCSPDGIVKGKYGLELKNPLPKTQVKYLLDGVLPAEYFGQVQFSLMVTGFDYWDFMSYVGCMKPLLLRVKRDEKFISALKIEVEKFCDELDEVVKRIK